MSTDSKSVLSAAFIRALRVPTGSYAVPTFMATLLAIPFLAIAWKYPIWSRLSLQQSTSGTAALASEGEQQKLDKKKERPYGEWTPVSFRYPKFDAWPCELSDTKPIPYRPFRWSSYHVTMGTRNMLWSDWIELDNQYERYQRIRARRIQTQGHGVIQVLDDAANPIVKGGNLAAVELVHELAEYLSRRYPTTFHVSRHPKPRATEYKWGWDDLPPIKSITVVPLQDTHELPLSPNDGDRAAERAMIISALLVQDDFAIMIEGSDGRYYFQAGAICVPGFWRMRDKIGMPLDEIHISGNVPQYREKLHISLERFFRRLPVEKPVIRNNYFFQTVRPLEERIGSEDAEELAWSESTNGPEDDFEHGDRFAPPKNRAAPTPETLRLRTERQTLRRLPVSGAVIFTIRTYVTALEELGKERGVPGRLASSMRSWPTEVGEYKGKDRGDWYQTALAYLDECHRQQVDGGETENEGKIGEGGYPY